MGTVFEESCGGETFQLLENRAREIVKRIRLLEEENMKLKMQNSKLLTQKEKVRGKVRELLDRVGARAPTYPDKTT